ncbi:hypothetical protein L7F22_046238 [Adiantum nelumboides]|nr:hypothetical protein [Adiantum nelumboides]
MRLALKLANKSYDLSATSNASPITIRLVDGCSTGPRCNFTQFKALKTQRGSFEYPSVSRLVMRLALELGNKSYDLPASSNASRLTIRLANECLESPRCNFTQCKALKTQREPFEHPSASRLVMRLALELANKSYDLPASSNASHITIRLADECLEGPRCIFSALNCVKLQRGPVEHPSASRMVMRLALEVVDKSYDLLASSNASRITKRLADGCSEGPRCVFSALDCVKLQHGPTEHPSANRMTPMYPHGESTMIADSTSNLDVLSRELLFVGVMSTGLEHEGIAHGGEQEVDTLLHIWLDATSGSDAWTVLGTGASLVEHESSTYLSLLRRLSEFDQHLEPVGIGSLSLALYIETLKMAMTKKIARKVSFEDSKTQDPKSSSFKEHASEPKEEAPKPMPSKFNDKGSAHGPAKTSGKTLPKGKPSASTKKEKGKAKQEKSDEQEKSKEKEMASEEMDFKRQNKKRKQLSSPPVSTRKSPKTKSPLVPKPAVNSLGNSPSKM